jgi:hypothetical protein
MPVELADVRAVTSDLPRSYEVLVRDRVKFRVGRLVYLALSRDETLLGFAYPRDARDSLIAADPDTFLPPVPSDERYNWLRLRMAAIDADQLREIAVDA